MKKNMGILDRTLRVVAAILVSVLYFTGTITGTVALVVLGLGVVFLLTSLVSFCPLYTVVGISTCATKK